LLVLAEHDEFRTPDDIIAETHDWTATRVEVIPGASHFFVGRTDRVVAVAADYVAELRARPATR
jgi:alpha/beta superfamily hydrolase